MALPHTGRPTSQAAAEEMIKPATAARVRVLQNLVGLEPVGATADRVQRTLGLKHQTNSPRFVELEEDSLIYDTGNQRPTISGHRAIVWRPTIQGVHAITAGWYHGQRLTERNKRESHAAQMRAALAEALSAWALNTTDSKELARIAELEKLTKPSTRR